MHENIDQDIFDVVVKAYPEIYKDPELGRILCQFAQRRKNSEREVTLEYIRWVRKQIDIM